MLRRALALIVVALVLPYACAPFYRFPEPRPFEGAHIFNPYAHIQGHWQRANLHAHGRAWIGLTSGRQTDADVVKAYRARGYDVAGISDYFRIASSHGVDSIPLYEHGMNVGKHHQVAIGAHYVDWFDFPFWQGVNQKQYVINRVKASADLVALAHPSIARGGYSAPDLAQLTGYDLFEVMNGKFAADDLWDAALSSGHAVWAVGNDDTHDVTAPDRMAVAWNMIDSPSAATSDIVAALHDGRCYVVARTNGDVDRSDPAVASISVDDDVVQLRLTSPAQVSFIGQNGRELLTVPDTASASYRFAKTDTYVRTVVRAPHTVMYLNPALRYDGNTWSTPPAAVDGTSTWTMRCLILFGCGVLVALGWRRRTPRRRALTDISRLKRASLFGIVAALVVGLATPAYAQQPTAGKPEAASVGEGPPLGSTLTIDLLRDLPTSENLFSVLETTQAELITDRFSGGGVNYGTAARVGAFGGTWTQTQYRIGDVNVTDGAVDGAPLFFPEVSWWEQMNVASGVVPPDANAPGALITLEPRKPGPTWVREGSASTSFGDTFTGHGGTLAVPLSSPTAWNHASVVASGPLIPERAGLFFAGSWTETSQRNRANPNEVSAHAGSVFANLVFTPTPTDEIRTVGIVQRVTRPEPDAALFAAPGPTRDDLSVHVQSTWQSRGDVGTGWRAFASFTQRTSSQSSTSLTGVSVERVTSGPIPGLVAIGDRTDRRWSAGVRFAPAPREMGIGNHIAQVGADVTGLSADVGQGFTGSIGELDGGIPARLWKWSAGGSNMNHRATTAALFASDRIQVPSRLVLDVALRYEFVAGSASGAATNVRWNSVLPRAGLRWLLFDRFGTALFGAYARSAYQMPIDALSWGDPAGPTANIFQWGGPATNALPALTGPLVGRWGPGTGGDQTFSGIDPNLKRPYSDQVTFGIEAHPTDATRVQLAAVGKWDRQLLGIVNNSTAAPLYQIVGVPDAGLDLANPAAAQVLPVSNLVLTPGIPYRYQFLLTNPADATARLLAVKLSAEARSDKLFVLLGATAGLADGIGGNIGYGPLENDPGVIGDAYANPNAAIFNRGRLFNDRAFTIKLTTIYRFPLGIRLGAIARYQDGQPFSRIVIVPALNQGADEVRAFESGGSRFTYTGTLDLRLQKDFVSGSRTIAIVLDGFSVVNLGNEVEENVLSGAAFRTPTAVQPPPMLHVGARISF